MTGARISTAGWAIPKIHAGIFPEDGSHLARYAQVFKAVEINSSFYRPHRRATYERWAQTVPPDFRFSVKMPRSITHGGASDDSADLIARFGGEIAGLGKKLGVVLIQLPPRAAWQQAEARHLFSAVSKHIKAPLAIEPRHASWFTPRPDAQLHELGIARVAADPPRAENAGAPGGCRRLAYYRWHGSPRIYYSSYDAAALARLRAQLADDNAQSRNTWCIFDNTAAFAAIPNAVALQESA